MGLAVRDQAIAPAAMPGPPARQPRWGGVPSGPPRGISDSSRRGWGPGASAKKMAGLATGLMALVVVVGAGQQPQGTVYTAAQAAAGRAAYQANCANCHMPDLGGRNEAPPLAGANFMNTGRARTTKKLFDYMSGTMPPDVPSLAADQYLAIAAFVLQSNGAPAGTQPFAPATAVPIGTIATGTAPQGAFVGADPSVRPGPIRGSAPTTDVTATQGRGGRGRG